MVDYTSYNCGGKSILFLSPYQTIQWKSEDNLALQLVQFHGDFYCIEYHKEEVACNGLLFNAIYLHPYLNASDELFAELIDIFERIKKEQKSEQVSDAVLKTYLQLILALCSKEKLQTLANASVSLQHSDEVEVFKNLLETHYLKERSVSFYADKFHLTTDAFGKKVKKLIGKTPTQLIQDRVILEAKKQLHLSHSPIKQIAAHLNFQDEFYFSRYFKKAVGISPSSFREQVGISIVAQNIS